MRHADRLRSLPVLVAVTVFSASAAACPVLLDRSIPGLLDGKPRSLCEFSGRVLLVVNTASRCGYTGQYAGLERLQDSYGKRGLTVLGFPSNDFGNQEPGSDRDIAEFCSMTYGVKFPMFSKTAVLGAQRHPFYADLARAAGAEPAWNFHKYLIGRDGRTVQSFPSNLAPDSNVLIREIEGALAR